MPVTLINYYLPRKLDAGTTLLKKSNAFYVFFQSFLFGTIQTDLRCLLKTSSSIYITNIHRLQVSNMMSLNAWCLLLNVVA